VSNVKHGKPLTPETDLTAPQPPLNYYPAPSPESRVIAPPASDDDRLGRIETELVALRRSVDAIIDGLIELLKRV
jgi:hypothetical protein